MINWSTAKDGVVAEALRDSETFLAGTVSIATSADQRAAVIAGTFATAGAAIVAGIIGFAAAASADNFYAPAVYAGGLCAAFLFILGSIFCISAAMPVGFSLPGTKPSNWESDVTSGHTLLECQHDLLHIREKAIKENLETIKRNARRFTIGAYLGIAAPVVGAIFWGSVLLFRHCV